MCSHPEQMVPGAQGIVFCFSQAKLVLSAEENKAETFQIFGAHHVWPLGQD